MQTRIPFGLTGRNIPVSLFRFMTLACLALMLTSVLSACQHVPENARELYLPNKQRWVLRSPAAFNGELETVQKLSAEFNGQPAVMLMQLEIDRQAVRLAMLNPTMISLFSLEDNGEQIRTERSAMIPDKLDPKYVLADIQLCYWPLAALTPSLHAAGLQLSEIQTPGGKLRRLTDNNGDVLVSIDYVLQTINFENHVWHYRYRIDTVSWELQ